MTALVFAKRLAVTASPNRGQINLELRSADGAPIAALALDAAACCGLIHALEDAYANELAPADRKDPQA